MAIIIDAEKPHACWACDFRCGLNIIARTEEEGIPDDCPIIGEIPDKHGRLIDADKLRGETNYLICTDCEVESCEDCDVEWCKNIIENAPTVLEAST
jgi:hypothetical protein